MNKALAFSTSFLLPKTHALAFPIFFDKDHAGRFEGGAIIRDAHKRFRDGKRLNLGWTMLGHVARGGNPESWNHERRQSAVEL